MTIDLRNSSCLLDYVLFLVSSNVVFELADDLGYIWIVEGLVGNLEVLNSLWTVVQGSALGGRLHL